MCLCVRTQKHYSCEGRRLFSTWGGVLTDHVIHFHPPHAKRPFGEEAANSQDLRHRGVLTAAHLKTHTHRWDVDGTTRGQPVPGVLSGSLSSLPALMPHFSAQVQQAALELAVFNAVACVLQPCDDGPVVLSSERMVDSSELHLLRGSPELRDQDLPWEKVPGRGTDRGRRGVSPRMVIPLWIRRFG